ncbi:MAG: hypothetical protein M3N54_09120 [Acidobacteriota bacterium]|nr:hypothetical protein [Acidobacteriota bacterium]
MDVTAHAGSDIQAEDKVKALEWVLQSDTFARSGRLRDLLRFLCEAEIAGKESELTEYTIGTVALGRPRDFSPLEDSSVRSRTYELRQKLEKFYAQECPAAPLRIELRKGSYVPRFLVTKEEHTGTPEQVPAPPFTSPPVTSLPDWPSSRSGLWLIALAFVAGIAVALAGSRIMSDSSGTRLASGWTPELETIWRPFIDTATPTLIVVETRFFVHIGPLMVRDWTVNSIRSVEQSEPLMRVKRLFGVQQLFGTPNYTDAGNPQALFYLTRLLSSRIRTMFVKTSLEISTDDFKNYNVILLGRPWMDPQIERLLARGELVDQNGKIQNVHPNNGELPLYVDRTDPRDSERWSEKFSVISMMQGSSPDKRILTLTGSGSEHPAALAFYLTNPEASRELVKRMSAAGRRPTGLFQVLVRSEFRSNSILKVEYVTSRPLK